MADTRISCPHRRESRLRPREVTLFCSSGGCASVGAGVGDGSGEGVSDGVGEGVKVEVAAGDAFSEASAEGVAEGDDEGLKEGDWVEDGVALNTAVGAADGVAMRMTVSDLPVQPVSKRQNINRKISFFIHTSVSVSIAENTVERKA